MDHLKAVTLQTGQQQTIPDPSEQPECLSEIAHAPPPSSVEETSESEMDAALIPLPEKEEKETLREVLEARDLSWSSTHRLCLSPRRDFQLIIRTGNSDEDWGKDAEGQKVAFDRKDYEDDSEEVEFEDEVSFANVTQLEQQMPNTTDMLNNKDLTATFFKKKLLLENPLPVPCSQPMDEGSCSHYELLWYYSPESNECRPFVYSGCGGNSNRFSSKQECIDRCVERKKD
ncbi:amyloid-beta precursor protein [Hemiscyllium ocellatum]|uniref:amyloid-beta precursor protein n=1 Tax=Hemiscyllium ocellatum TaxID=170820 RepID=UPI00296695B0|nr:amyloid-beta precursor protein [Hemiscyllium ocellatum]